MSPNDVHSILSQAGLLLEAGKPAETLTCLRQIPVLAEDELRIRCASLRAWALSELGHTDQAVDALRPLLAAFPESPVLLRAFGVVLLNEGNLEHACEVLEEALELEPEEPDPSTLANLALVYERLRDYPRAMELYDEAGWAGVDLGWLLERKAVAQAEFGDTAAAKATLRRLLSIKPDDAEQLLSLASLHTHDEEYEQAFACFQAAEKIAPNHTALRLHWGMAAARAGCFSQAEYQLRALRRLEPGAARAALLDAVIGDCRGDAGVAQKYQVALACADLDESQVQRQALEMAMDYFVRHEQREPADALFRQAYRHNACTIEVCEAYRQVAGEWATDAVWYSLLVEADHRAGLLEISDRRGDERGPYRRYVRNVQVLARDRDDALARVLDLLERMGERNAAIVEFVSEEAMQGAYLGLYEIEAECAVFAAGE